MKLKLGEEVLDFDPTKILNVEAIAIQKYTGLGTKEWMDACQELDPLALTGLVWIARKRTQPDLAFADVSFPLFDVGWELSPEEQAEFDAEQAAKAQGKDELLAGDGGSPKTAKS